MGILKEVILCVSIILAATSESRPISLQNYAPSHEYKSTDYSFSYGVKDPHTGDVKNQWEEKKDNIVRGEYSMVEPDGSTRTVQYTADDKNGFNAVVKYDQHSVHPITQSKEAYSHNSLKLSPSRETTLVYNSYKNNAEEASLMNHPEVQTVVQHEYKLPQSYSEIQNQVIQQIDSQETKRNEQVPEQQTPNPQVEYIYIPQKENTSEDYKLEQSQAPGGNENLVQSTYAYESNQYDAKQQDAEQHESEQQEVQQIVENHEQNFGNEKYTFTNIQTKLPLNLNILPESSNKIPVEINLLNPIDIDLTKVLKGQINNDVNQESAAGEQYRYSTKDYSIQPSHQFTSEEVQKFIDDYNSKLGMPVYETGFVPINTKSNQLITQPMIPNTYRSNLKVNMTPGLKHYSSRGNKQNFKRNKYEASLFPLFYTTGALNDNLHRNEYKFQRSVPIRNQFVRNGKQIRFMHF